MIGADYDTINSYSGSAYADSYPAAYNADSARTLPNASSKTVPAEKIPTGSDPEPAVIRNPGESTERKAGKKSSPAECQTCKERKYQDGSDEDVSFKAAAHIDPNAAASRVRGHEQEHVSNAYKDAAENNGKVLSCSVSIKTSVCPECGRTYVSGGTTATQIKYFNEDNPYQKEMKSSDAVSKYRGRNIDTGF